MTESLSSGGRKSGSEKGKRPADVSQIKASWKDDVNYTTANGNIEIIKFL